jgi:hypothetical protein
MTKRLLLSYYKALLLHQCLLIMHCLASVCIFNNTIIKYTCEIGSCLSSSCSVGAAHPGRRGRKLLLHDWL